MIDHAALQSRIASARRHPQLTERGENGIIVSLSWLEQVAEEIGNGRAAMAALRRKDERMAQLIDDMGGTSNDR